MVIAALILTVIASLALWEERTVDRICDDMLKNVEKLKSAEKSSLGEKVEKVQREWTREKRVLQRLTPHDNAEEIDLSWSIYRSRINNGDYTEAGYVLDEISQHFLEMREKIKFNAENIF